MVQQNMRHNRPNKKEKPEKVWQNEFDNLRNIYGFTEQKKRP
jgi:hypothetical protein